MDLNLYQISGLALFIYMSGWYLISMIFKKGDIADIAWGLGFIFISLVCFFYHPHHQLIQIIVLTVVIIWGLRLSIFIGIRNHGKPEDFRYQNWRKNWKFYPLQAFLRIFMLQGFLLYLIAIPIIWIMNQSSISSINHWFLGIGIIIWLIGFLVESIADQQKHQFKKTNSKKSNFIQSGLWKYSKHPNYFGEIICWWGIYLMICSYPSGWITIIGPLTITFLIKYVSGVPLAEEKYEDNEDYQKYRQKTNELVMWFKKD